MRSDKQTIEWQCCYDAIYMQYHSQCPRSKSKNPAGNEKKNLIGTLYYKNRIEYISNFWFLDLGTCETEYAMVSYKLQSLSVCKKKLLRTYVLFGK